MTPLEFEASNDPSWRKLEKFVGSAERDLDPDLFLNLYRTCCEHFALAQARGFPAHVIERLSIVTGRAHQIVYRQSEFGVALIRRVLLNDFPRMVRQHLRYMVIAALLVFIPAIALGIATYIRPDLVLSVVDTRTAADFERMYSPAAQSIGRLRDVGSNWTMFGFYIMNNIGIAFQCYVTGVIFGLGSLFFLVSNGVFGGAVAGYVSARGNGATFFTFIATHSAFELTAIVICGGAGLRVGRSVLLPGRLPRLLSLQTAARETSLMVFGASVMLVVAAALEAFWSSAAWVPAEAKLSCAALCWFLVLLFFSRRPNAA
jgi:uncharacterized membrane protein SpoIIM required for sporulation